MNSGMPKSSRVGFVQSLFAAVRGGIGCPGTVKLRDNSENFTDRVVPCQTWQVARPERGADTVHDAFRRGR